MNRVLLPGLCRADLRTEDVSLAAGMLGAALRGRDANERRHLAERAIALLWQGLLARSADSASASNASPSPANNATSSREPATDAFPYAR